MSKVLVLYYSSYGHVERLAEAVVEGARSVPGVEVALKRVPELMPREIAEKAGVKLDQAAPIATVDELAEYDAIIFGTPTRFGNMTAQMRYFLDQTGGLWMKGALVGKVGSVFASTGPSMAGRKRRSPPSTRRCSITAWSSSACLRRARPHQDDRDHRRHALRRDDDRGHRRQAPAERERARNRALSRRPCREDRRQAGGVSLSLSPPCGGERRRGAARDGRSLACPNPPTPTLPHKGEESPGHFPAKTGLRFSMKARRPSM